MKHQKILSLVTVIALLVSSLYFFPSETSAAQKPKLNKTKISLSVGKSYTLKLKNYKKKVTWKSSNKKIATISSKGKIKAKKKGKTKITAKFKLKNKTKKLTCKVTVKAKKSTVPTSNKEHIKISFYDNLDTCGPFTDGNQKYELSQIKVTWKHDNTFGDNSMNISFSGKKVSDSFGNTHNFPVTINYKIYNTNNAVVESGFAMTPSICVGDTFENVETTVSLSIPDGSYIVRIENS